MSQRRDGLTKARDGGAWPARGTQMMLTPVPAAYGVPSHNTGESGVLTCFATWCC